MFNDVLNMVAFANVQHQLRERHFCNKDALILEFTDEELRDKYRFGSESIIYLEDLLRHDLHKKNHVLSVCGKQVMVTLKTSLSKVLIPRLPSHLLDLIQ